MNHEIVQSAITSFNNAALLAPGFFWTAVLALPIYLAVWKIAPDVSNLFFPAKKSRDYNFAWIAECAIIAWIILNNGNWAVIRDGFGFLPYLEAAVLFALCKDAAARLYEQNPRLPKAWQKTDRATKTWIKIGALAVSTALFAAGAIQQFNFIALRITAVMFGAAAGFFGRRSFGPINLLTIAMFALSIAITLQPEFFRFGQLGRLGVVHLSSLACIAALGAVIFVFRNFKPADWIFDNHYRYMKWFMRLSSALAFVLFAMTESAPILIGFGAAVAATAFLAVKHAPRERNIKALSGDLWAVMLCLFGAITTMPLITVVGILCWRNNNTRSFWHNLYLILK
ncbi:MAG: hypothetical protein LBQ49_02835 [Rickettsiales bacterium]|nr:hypothetical protein [Rickettsiales bacterium]